MKITFSVFIILMYSFSFHVYAAPPKFVYRYDSRSPDEIFKYGFTATGANDGINDPLEHIADGDILDNSRFISTTESPGTIVRTFTDLQLAQEVQEIYLYRIRATSNFYSMVDYLNNLRQIGFITGDPRAPFATTLLNTYEHQREWFAVDRIEANQVTGVQRLVNRGDGSISIGPEELNNNYIDRNTHASTAPYPLVEGPVPPSLSFLRGRVGPMPNGTLMGPPSPPARGFLGSLFSCFPSGSGSSGRSSTNKQLKCEADVTMSLGYYYGLIENTNDIM